MPGPSVFPSGEPGVSGDFWVRRVDSLEKTLMLGGIGGRRRRGRPLSLFTLLIVSIIVHHVKQVACSREPVIGKGGSSWTGKTTGEPRGTEGPGGPIAGLALKGTHLLSLRAAWRSAPTHLYPGAFGLGRAQPHVC